MGMAPILAFQALAFGKHRRGLKQRLGFYPQDTLLRLRSPVSGPQSGPVWLHAVSVGEVLAASPLIPLLKARHPELDLLVTTVTEAGNQVAQEKLKEADAVFYFPLDAPFAVERALTSIKPRLVLLAETELWPNFLRGCSKRGIPVILVNGRLSSRSFRRYRLAGPFFRRVLQGIELFFMQSGLDAERIVGLGAPPSKVKVLGNLKFDALAEPGQDGGALREALGLEEDIPLFIAGSTHRGEEEAVLDAYLLAKAAYPDLILILAPRHLERVPEVEALLQKRGVLFVRRTQLKTRCSMLDVGCSKPEVILVDTMGELRRLYALGGVVFVGGSLVPIGGHNVLEPAQYSRPILFGPHMENLAEVSGLFLSQGAAIQVRDREELGTRLLELLSNPSMAVRIGRAASSIVASQGGATLRTADLLEPYLR